MVSVHHHGWPMPARDLRTRTYTRAQRYQASGSAGWVHLTMCRSLSGTSPSGGVMTIHTTLDQAEIRKAGHIKQVRPGSSPLFGDVPTDTPLRATSRLREAASRLIRCTTTSIARRRSLLFHAINAAKATRSTHLLVPSAKSRPTTCRQRGRWPSAARTTARSALSGPSSTSISNSRRPGHWRRTNA
jgi:hypothetical protein